MRAFSGFAIRDSALLALTLLGWALSIVPKEGWIGGLLGGMTGLCALLLHEWGHLYGAHRAAAIIHPAPRLWLPFLFDVDSANNTREQFLSISLWGFAATFVFLVMFMVFLPLNELAGRVALGVGALLASLTVIIEFPIAWRVYRGYSIPKVEIYRR